MEGQVKIALIGLGKVGTTLLKKLIPYENRGIAIVAVLEKNSTSAGLELAKQKGIPVYLDEREIIDMGDKVDIIFNLTGLTSVERSMKLGQVKKGNPHTVIVSRTVAELMWRLISEEALPEHTKIAN